MTKSLALLPACALLAPLALLAQDLDLSIDEQYLQPEVTVQEHENRTIEEYRVNGNLYRIKVTPNVGPPYFLVDPTGSGDLEMRRGPGAHEMQVPQWALFRW